MMPQQQPGVAPPPPQAAPGAPPHWGAIQPPMAPQHQYAPPPTQQAPPPPQMWGQAPPPQAAYGQAPPPPQAAYGQAPPPPQAAYGQAPPPPQAAYGQAPPPPQAAYYGAPPAPAPAPAPMAAAPAGPSEVRTLWIGDLQYWMDENYIYGCFASTGEAMGTPMESWVNLLEPNGDTNDLCFDDFQVETQVEISQVETHADQCTPPLKPSKKRTRNFIPQEDNMLVRAWLEVSLDPVQGTDQTRSTYWRRIHDYYHEHKTFESERNISSLSHRWGIIHKSVNRFCGCYTQVQNRRESGLTEQDKIERAKEMYQEKDPEGKPFTFMHCWVKLQHEEDESSRERRLIFSGREAVQCQNWFRKENDHSYI